MREVFRDGDSLFRYGGEEFIAILAPTPVEEAWAIFERFRQAIEVHKFPQIGKVTASIGFVRINTQIIASEVVGHADQALYFAKKNGRNQVCYYDELVEQG